MRQFLLKIAAVKLLMLAVIGLDASATHMAGGFIRYQSTGVPHQYNINLTLYRDCSGIQLNIDPVVYFRKECGGPFFGQTLVFISSSGQPVPQYCTNSPSTCNGGSRYGLEKYVWEGLVTLPFDAIDPQCNRWTLTWGGDAVEGFPARNTTNTIENSGNTNFFIESFLDDNGILQQSAPVFVDSLIPAYCVNQPVAVNFYAQDPDGDSLSFSLVPALSAYNTPVIYAAGYSPTLPAIVNGSISINPQNGNISFNSSNPQTTVFVLRMDKFRNGVLIGFIKFDVQILLGIFPYCSPIFNTVSIENCLQVILPSGPVTQSGTYLDTFYAADCRDSIVTYLVNVKQPSSSYSQDTACDQLEWNGQTITQTGRYIQILRNVVDCDSIVELDVLVDRTPTRPLEFDTFVCARSYLPIPYPGPMRGRLDWYRDSSLTQFVGSGNIIPLEIFEDTTNLFLVFRSIAGCTSPVARVLVVNEDEELKRSLPNAFTPNSDNINDVWEVSWIYPLELMVFDRWGLLVWKDEGLTVRWDGGNRTPGAYPYILGHTGCTGRKRYKNGIIHLVK